MSTIVPFLEQPLVTILTGAYIKSGTGGDATKMAARATELAAIVTALQAYNNEGGPAALAALQTALETKIADPAEALAFNQTIVLLGAIPSVAQQALNATILGQAQTAILNSVAAAVLATCALYTSPPAPAAPAAA